ncbi:hypothetical protein LTS15_005134 [Exophiala xenobiotica]|nr:hypothetical protein LTS15_005134 [Exophiala xenobiotica]
MDSRHAEDDIVSNTTPGGAPEPQSINEKTAVSIEGQHLEDAPISQGNLVYDDDFEEPEIHMRTWVALAAMCLLSMAQLVALQGPPAVLSYIGTDLNGTKQQTWVPNALTLMQAVLGPVIASASDTFQARKPLLVGSSVVSFIGSAIAPGSGNIYRLIVAQILIGVGFASVPLGYCVPSEILPRKWRPMAQACINVWASFGAIASPLIIGAFTKSNVADGWRKFYWFQMALWGATAIGIFVGYRPPKRHTRFEHLSLWQKLGHLDLPGFALLTIGLTLFLVGVNLGGGLYTWTNAHTLSTLITGIVVLGAFGVYEWKGTKTGILHHDLFRGGKAKGRTFAILVGLIFIEGILLFAFVIFYPVMSSSIFETDPFLVVARAMPYWVAGLLATIVWGYSSTRLQMVREPLLLGFLLYTAGTVGLATIQPNQSTSQLVFAGLSGIGYGSPLILIVAGVQLSTPHGLIATATAVTTSSRAIAAAIFTAIYAAAFDADLASKLPDYVAKAAGAAGLPTTSIPAFVEALASGDTGKLVNIPGISPSIIAQGVRALKQAFADSLRVVFIIAAPFGALACVGCLFLGDMRKTMNYHVDAPVEDLHAKQHHHDLPNKAA